VREQFSRRFPPEAVESAELVASELVSNAVKYGRLDIVLTAHEGDGYLHIEVQDRGRSFDPAAPRSDGGGLGLAIVARLAEEWGVHEDDYGLLVWAKLRPALTEPFHHPLDRELG